MPKMICVKCEVELQPKKNGVIVRELMDNNTKTYRLWNADLLECPFCDTQIVAGFPRCPFMEHFDGDIEAKLEELRTKGKVIIRDNEVPGCGNWQ